MITVGAFEAKTKLSALLDKVEAGETNWVSLVDSIYKPFHKLIIPAMLRAALEGRLRLTAARP